MGTWLMMALIGLLLGLVFGLLVHQFMGPKTIKEFLAIIFGLGIGTLIVLAIRLISGQSFLEAVSAVQWIVYVDVVLVLTAMVLSFIFD